MKLKFIFIGISAVPIIAILIALFIRYQQIRSVSNYAECDISPKKVIVIIGTRKCFALDGRSFEFATQMTNQKPNIDMDFTGMPQVPPIFENKYTYYAYLIYHSPVVLYQQVRQTTYQFADYLLEIYFNIIHNKSK